MEVEVIELADMPSTSSLSHTPKSERKWSDTMSEVSLGSRSSSRSRSLFLDKSRQQSGGAPCQSGEFQAAVRHYTSAIAVDSTNHVLYSNRSAALVRVGEYSQALQDAIRARELNPKWPKAYYRQGVALQCLSRYYDALAAFASGLAQDVKSIQLLAGLVETALKSPLKETFEPVYHQLQKMKLDKSPFVVTSVVGQGLLSVGAHPAAAVVLESALRVGTCSLKLRGSVLSALSSAYWLLGNVTRAIAYMQQDLTAARSLGDHAGECRVHGNLGSAHFYAGAYTLALNHHRFQLVLAMKLQARDAASQALASLGHVYTAVGDYPNALASHKQCVVLVRQRGDQLAEAREIGNVGAVYLAMADFDSAVECHKEHLKIATEMGNRMEEARAYSNLGSAHHYRRNFDQAITFHNNVLKVAVEVGDRTLEARAYAGLGHAFRCMGDYNQARTWHEKQLDTALTTKDKVAEGRACSNLGIIFQLLGQYEPALKLHSAHLRIAQALKDQASQGRAYGNIGNAYSSMGHYEQAIKFHREELMISKEVNDRNSEASTHGNLAVAYQALGMHEQALQHYRGHLQIATDLKDSGSEARALSNLGNYHSARGDFSLAVPYFERFLVLSQEIHDIEGEGRACHNLGYAHYCLGNYSEAVRHYDQDLALAKDLQDRVSMGRAYCNLGLAHKQLAALEPALECQKYFLAIAHTLKNVAGKFRALGNIGDVLALMGSGDEALTVYNQQLALARQSRCRPLEAAAYAALGAAHRQLGALDKALGYHTQELAARQELGDLRGECRAHAALGAVHSALCRHTSALKCYGEQLERARDAGDAAVEAQAHGNLGITRMNMSLYEDAIGCFEQQLALLEQASPTAADALADKARAHGNLGDCYEALGDHEEALACHGRFLALAQNSGAVAEQERAYRGLGNAHRAVGNLQQALVCFEKRLVLSHDLDDAQAKGLAYGELGCLHSLLGNYEQAISCLEHQLRIAQEKADKMAEGDAACGLGGVYQQMGEYDTALRYHQLDLDIAEETGSLARQGRACGNLGVSHESLGNFEQAVSYQEQHLSIAAQMNDRVGKSLAYSSLGRVHHALGNYPQAVSYLQQALQIAEQLGRREDEAKIRHRLGLALWGHRELEEAQTQLYKAADLFESHRRESHTSNEYKLSLFDLQTASYQALQRVLVALNRTTEALVVAERGRTRAFVDLLLERQTGGATGVGPEMCASTPATVEQIVDVVSQQRASVLYYSLVAGFLYSWLILPDIGVVKFHQCSLSDLDQDDDGRSDVDGQIMSTATVSTLDQCITDVREALGVETTLSGAARSSEALSETETEADDVWQQQQQQQQRHDGGKDRSSSDFLRMTSRSHACNSSSYSLYSASGSVSSSGGGGGNNSRAGSLQRRHGNNTDNNNAWANQPVRELYATLVAPFEDLLMKHNGRHPRRRELVLVLQGDLYLVPFAVLRGENDSEYLYERFAVVVVPSIRDMAASAAGRGGGSGGETVPALVLGNPLLPASVGEKWRGVGEEEVGAEMETVAELLGTRCIAGVDATKEELLRRVANAECLHLAARVSWKLSAIVLAPRAAAVAPPGGEEDGEAELHDSGSEVGSSLAAPPALADFLLTAADILDVRLSAKLVVLTGGDARASADGVVGLTRALLAAGAQCVVVPLWPAPGEATHLLMKTFYTSLLQGSRVSHALCEAMRFVRNTKQFSHPSHWAGFLIIGSDVKLTSKVAQMGHSLCNMIQDAEGSRDAMRVVLHLVEKSLQRINRGLKNPMYTTQQSIELKVSGANGWKELLKSVGFRFETGSNGLPPSVFFPMSDPGERLVQCSTSLQALLGLSTSTLVALSKLLPSPECAQALSNTLRHVIGQSTPKDKEISVQLPVSVKMWRQPGGHEFLASLGFELMEVGKQEVTLKTGKQANRRQMNFALQALLALFDTSEAPKQLPLDSCSSMESLASSQNDTPTSPTASPTTPPPSRDSPPAGGDTDRADEPAGITLALQHQSRIRAMYISTDSGGDRSSIGSDGQPGVVARLEGAPGTRRAHETIYARSTSLTNGYHSDTAARHHDAIYGSAQTRRRAAPVANGYHSDAGRSLERGRHRGGGGEYEYLNGVSKMAAAAERDERVKDILQTSIANDAFCVDPPSRTNSTVSLVRQVAPRGSNTSLCSSKTGSNSATDIALKVLAETHRERQAVEHLHQTSLTETRRFAFSQRQSFGRGTDGKGPLRPRREHYAEPYLCPPEQQRPLLEQPPPLQRHLGESDGERGSHRRSISPLVSESSTPEADAYRRVAPPVVAAATTGHARPPAYHQVVHDPPTYADYMSSPGGHRRGWPLGGSGSLRRATAASSDFSDYRSSIETLTDAHQQGALTDGHRSYSQSSLGSDGSASSAGRSRAAPAPPRRRSSLNNDVRELRKSCYEQFPSPPEGAVVAQSDAEQRRDGRRQQGSKVTGMAKFTVSRTSPDYSKVRASHGVNVNSAPLQLAGGAAAAVAVATKSRKNFVIQSSRC